MKCLLRCSSLGVKCANVIACFRRIAFKLGTLRLFFEDIVFNGNVFMIQVRALCEKAKEILMDESNVQVLYSLMLFFSGIRA